ncbi:MAG: ssDNA-binding domain-containing protein [Lachnospiraceae bacterium]|nr:ssDNA-binding domain-containing protein [Lachnospiraceae bacterium]
MDEWQGYDLLNEKGEYRLERVAVRLVSEPPLISDKPLDSPQAAVSVIGPWLHEMDRALFCIVIILSDGKPINLNVCSVGGLNETLANPREIMKTAILSNSSSMLILHNHPSGSLKPSAEDIATTDRMQKVGELLGIPLLDHIITGHGKEFYSFRECGRFPAAELNYARTLEELRPLMGAARERGSSYNAAESEKQKAIKEITDKLEQGVKDLFSTERYKEYLKIMARFHDYSFNNSLLIYLQRPNATHVAGYKSWPSFNRFVNLGEQGIRILAPTPYKRTVEKPRLDPVTRNPMRDEKGELIMERKVVVMPAYKIVNVFDVSQTSGEELPEIVTELDGKVDSYGKFMGALQQFSPVPIEICEIHGAARGYYHLKEKKISIRQGMSEQQTVKTAIHELAHAILHDSDTGAERNSMLDQNTREVQAESVVYAVCSYYGIDTGDYTFGYIAGWSKNRELKELKDSMNTIRNATSQIIKGIDDKMVRIEENEKTPLDSVSVELEKDRAVREEGKPKMPERNGNKLMGETVRKQHHRHR